MAGKANKRSTSGKREKRAHVTLPGEMRPLLDKAQEMLEESSWTNTVQNLLIHFTSSEAKRDADKSVDLEQIKGVKERAVDEALERVTEAFSFAFDSAGLKIKKELIAEALRAVTADSDPEAFAEFTLKFHQEIEQKDKRNKGLESRLKSIMSLAEKHDTRLEKIEQAMLTQKPQQIVIKNADADADADSDAD